MACINLSSFSAPRKDHSAWRFTSSIHPDLRDSTVPFAFATSFSEVFKTSGFDCAGMNLIFGPR